MEMARLGAEGVAETPQVPDTSGMSMVRAPAGEAAVGGRVSVHFAGVGIWCRGEVLAYDATLEVGRQFLLPSTEACTPFSVHAFQLVHAVKLGVHPCQLMHEVKSGCACFSACTSKGSGCAHFLDCFGSESGWAWLWKCLAQSCCGWWAQKHQILYEDGEHEWTRLSREAHTWWPACPDTPYPAGLPPGEFLPHFIALTKLESLHLLGSCLNDDDVLDVTSCCLLTCCAWLHRHQCSQLPGGHRLACVHLLAGQQHVLRRQGHRIRQRHCAPPCAVRQRRSGARDLGHSKGAALSSLCGTSSS